MALPQLRLARSNLFSPFGNIGLQRFLDATLTELRAGMARDLDFVPA